MRGRRSDERRKFSYLRDERQIDAGSIADGDVETRVLASLDRENGGKYDSRGIQLSDWRERRSVRAGRTEILG